ncbi:MAG: hypothetical protein ACN2B6_01430 [Rickettsiales bacterium]
MGEYVFKSLNTTQLTALQKEIHDACQEGGAIVTVAQETITDKQRRSLHKWFEMCANELNKSNNWRRHPLTGVECPWCKDTFKADVYKPFIKKFKGMKSTNDQGRKTPTECLEALTSYFIESWNVVLPEWPSIENMSMADLLR